MSISSSNNEVLNDETINIIDLADLSNEYQSLINFPTDFQEEEQRSEKDYGGDDDEGEKLGKLKNRIFWSKDGKDENRLKYELLSAVYSNKFHINGLAIAR
jgi:hypothetical protein